MKTRLLPFFALCGAPLAHAITYDFTSALAPLVGSAPSAWQATSLSGSITFDTITHANPAFYADAISGEITLTIDGVTFSQSRVVIGIVDPEWEYAQFSVKAPDDLGGTLAFRLWSGWWQDGAARIHTNDSAYLFDVDDWLGDWTVDVWGLGWQSRNSGFNPASTWQYRHVQAPAATVRDIPDAAHTGALLACLAAALALLHGVAPVRGAAPRSLDGPRNRTELA